MLEFDKTAGQSAVMTGSEATFAKDVIEASREIPVIAYFRADWCGPCKSLGPALEKAVNKAAGDVRLVKIDVDTSPRLATQLGVRSIPAVFAFVDNQPIDGFIGAKTESELDKFVAKLRAEKGGDKLAAAVDEANRLLDEGAAVEAAQAFAAILSEFPQCAAAYGGLVMAHLAFGQIERAKAILNSVPDSIASEQEINAARAAAELAEQAASVGPTAELRARLQSNPNDHEARLDLATTLHASGKSDAAIDELLELFRRDREWRDGAAKEQLMRIFESLRPDDPVALKGRRRFSSIVFS